MKDENKLLILGLDGLDPFILKEYQEDLPNLATLLDENNILESVLPPVTKPGWPCSFTGRTPERLNSFDMLELESDFSYEFRPPKNIKFAEKGFWKYSDSKMAISGAPGSAATELNGWIVGGPLSADGDSTYPAELEDEIRENLGTADFDYSKSEKNTRKEALKKFERGKRSLNYFLNNKDAEVYFHVFRATDTLMHHSTSDEQLLKSYKQADEYLGELMNRDLNIMVLSDHGAVKTNESYSINTWFRDNGYLEMEDEEESGETPLWKKPLMKAGEKALKLGFKDQLVWLNDKYQSLTGEEFKDTSNFDLESVDWNNTEAFSYTIATCRYAGVWINDDRFPEPSVEDRQKKKEELKSEIERIEKVEEVLLKENAFIVDAPTFPDLVIIYNKGIKQDNQLRDTPSSEINTYMHRKQGFIGTYGEIFEGMDEDANLIDIAPTVLHYLGDDIPEEMDGKVLDIFSDDSEPGKKKPKRVSEEISGLDI